MNNIDTQQQPETITLLSNEWYDLTATCRPWAGRTVLCRTDDDRLLTLRWTGRDWADPVTGLYTYESMHANVKQFCIFEYPPKYNN